MWVYDSALLTRVDVELNVRAFSICINNYILMATTQCIDVSLCFSFMIRCSQNHLKSIYRPDYMWVYIYIYI